MKLFFDTSDSRNTVVSFGHRKIVSPTSSDKSQQLLLLIEKILKASKRQVGDITEIEVSPGPGSYTGLKVGYAVADCLGFILKIPVNGAMVTEKNFLEPDYGK